MRLVARSIGVPKALLIVEDGGRRVAKAQHGWDSPVVLSGPPPADGRRAMPVVDPDVRAAASTSLRTRDGHVLGELFVFDRAPRDFGAVERTALEDGADLLAHEFELRAAARRALLGVRGAG